MKHPPQSRIARIALIALLTGLTLAPNTAPNARAAVPLAQGGVAGDFDGDGFADLAVGVPGEDVGTGPGRRQRPVRVLRRALRHGEPALGPGQHGGARDGQHP